ncbi:hypothetical protein Ancab_009071 [Ancistrocladus abbreviatus]
MPYCTARGGGEAAGKNGIQIFYRTYGNGPTKVLLIIGLAGTHNSWGPQIRGLTGTNVPNDAESESMEIDDNLGNESNAGVEVCAFDNRGMGRSSVPARR